VKENFKNYFSNNSSDYRQFRPSYPEELFYHLAHISPHHECAWDCATGTGQSAIYLAKYFQKVMATDASENQIRVAQQAKNVEYSVASAEHSGLADNSVNLITVAQALHWFNLVAFTKEVARILVDQGILAVWTYNVLKINDEIDRLVHYLYSELLDSYWPPERRIVESGYQDIHFPFTELEAPDFEMSEHWSLEQLLGYLNTWSAVKRFEAETSSNPVDKIASQIASAWGDASHIRKITWPLVLRLWRKP